MKAGDKVCDVRTNRPGIVVRIDKDHYGAGQAFKHLPRPREFCVDSTVADVLAPTKHGKQDRVMVRWTDDLTPGIEYIESRHLKTR
jgi:hypothetical protein